MEQPLPTMPQPQHENRCPDCLYMELKATPVQSDQIDLACLLHFNEQWEPVLGGRVKFGLKGGKLKLKLKNGEIPYQSRSQSGVIELFVPKEKEEKFLLPPLCEVRTNSWLNPAWVLELKMGGLVLKGSLQMEKLGTLHIKNLPCEVEATFEASLQYVQLIAVEGVYPSGISRNKQIIIERALAKHILQTKLKPYLSRAKFHYG